MVTEKNQVLNLIADYQAAVAKAANMLNTKAKEQPGFQRQQEQPGRYTGYLDEARQIRYTFHGAGCLVAGPEFEVDFDFALADRCDGINSWFLYYFLESNGSVKQKYALLTSADQVKQLMQELERDGLLFKNVDTLDEHLYYLVVDKHRSNPPNVVLH